LKRARRGDVSGMRRATVDLIEKMIESKKQLTKRSEVCIISFLCC
jgi:hypothetical protein